MASPLKLAQPANTVHSYHVASSLTGASTSILSRNPLPELSPNIVFAKAKRIPLPYNNNFQSITYDDVMLKSSESVTPITLDSISSFMLHTCGVTKLKLARFQEGGDLYSARANPSSGGLHPSEVYLLLPPGIVAGEDGALITHYHPTDHALQLRGVIDKSIWKELDIDPYGIILCCTSIYWREVWKYGLRGFRYSLLDAGHLMAAAAISANLLSWEATLLNTSAQIFEQVFGLNRGHDFPPLERHDFQFGMVIRPVKLPKHNTNLSVLYSQVHKFNWSGAASPMSKTYHDKEIKEVIEVALETTFSAQERASEAIASNQSPTASSSFLGEKVMASSIILNRRSAKNFIPKKHEGGSLRKASFYRMLERTVPSLAKWQAWQNLTSYQRMDSVWLVIYVHRVDGIKQGLYVLFRENLSSAEALERAQHFQSSINIPSSDVHKTVVSRPPDCPSYLHLFQLLSGIFCQYTAKISASQSLCGNGAFLISMMADMDRKVVEWGCSSYRLLHFEAGITGQLLYLEATADGKGATGVGAFYDDASALIFNGNAKTLYHFAVGQPTQEKNISFPISALAKRSPSSNTTCICGKAAPLVCARCKTVKYCSQECQKSHWRIHKPECIPSATNINTFSYVGELIEFFFQRDSIPLEQWEQLFSNTNVHIAPDQLYRLASLHPIPQSTQLTYMVPVEYFKKLQAVSAPPNNASLALFDKAVKMMREVGVELIPSLCKPMPANSTPKQMLERYKTLYIAAQILTLASSMNLDGWEFYASRALAFKEMKEYQLAWEDCMRCVSLVKSGHTRHPPPDKREYQLVTWTEELAEELAFEIGLKSKTIRFFPAESLDEDEDEFLNLFKSDDDARTINDTSLHRQRATDSFSAKKPWELGIMDKKSDTAEFLRLLDGIPGINSNAFGKRIWKKFPSIMKNNYVNFTAHPAGAKDPRFDAWKNTLQWLENEYLTREKLVLTVELLRELNAACVAKDGEAMMRENLVWGVTEGVHPIAQYRDFHKWVENGRRRAQKPSTEEYIALVEIDEIFRNTPASETLNEKFTKSQQKLVDKYYTALPPPEKIPQEMNKLVDWANSQKFNSMHPVQRAAILGLRLVHIHPFDNANGRTQQLLMSLVLMKEGYPPIVRRDLTSYNHYLNHDLLTLDTDPNCEMFTRWCAVNVALTMISADASYDQLHSYAEKLFVKKMVFEKQWSNGHHSLAPPAELNVSSSTRERDPTTNYKNHWIHVQSDNNNQSGNPDALPSFHLQMTISDIDELAVKNNILGGKWVLEVSEECIDNIWKHISQAILSGALPRRHSAKTSTALGFGVPPDFFSYYVVCVYTNNYLDESDVMSAAGEMKCLLEGINTGITNVRYKPDIYTHLNIYGGSQVSEWRYNYPPF